MLEPNKGPNELINSKINECQRGDLNSRPQGYESCALTS